MEFTDTFYGRPNTIRTYKSLFLNHMSCLTNSNINFKKWDESSTRYMLKTWNKNNLSRNTKITLIRILGRYVKFMGGPEIDTQKFIRELERSEQQDEVRVLSVEEVKRLTETAKRSKPKFYPIMLLALHAGLRRGEIFGLRCSDVDLIKGVIKVSHSYDGPTKNGRSRVIPMSKEMVNTMISTRNSVFRNPDEKLFERFDPNPTLKRLCKISNVPQIKFHDLRHTFASLALTNGINPKQVATWLGHSSVVTTLTIYWNLTREKADLSFLPE